MRRAVPILTTAFLAGCTSLGGTVRGDFTCRAPVGSCAPLSDNDAVALSRLVPGEERPAAAPRSAPVALGAATRAPERMLTVVIPAHVDAAGVLHDAATVHLVAEPARWTPAPGMLSPSPSPRDDAPSSREVTRGASASWVEGPGSFPARAPQSFAPLNLETRPAAPPSAAALDAARKGHRIAPSPTSLAPVPEPEGHPLPIRPLEQAPLSAPAGAKPTGATVPEEHF